MDGKVFAQLHKSYPFTDQRALHTVILALVALQLDYCNMLYMELTLKTTQKLQLLQNALEEAVRVC